MRFKNLLLSSSLLLGCTQALNAQTFIPTNMNFELGTTAGWTYYRGTVASGHVFSMTSSTTAAPGLHTVTSGSGTDMYGGFPVVGNGLHSLKLAFDTVDANADGASYNVHVPVGGTYNLVYHYAAVLQDTAHMPGMLPILKITATDSATGTVLADSLEILSSTPGLALSTTPSMIFYKPWTTGNINLAGQGGHTIIFKAVVGACATYGHFGYAYIDVSSVTLTSSLGSSSLQNSSAPLISVYPNPSSGVLNIHWADQQTGTVALEITDVTGRMLSSATLDLNATSGETQVNLGGLDNGIYLVTIKSGSINYCSKVVVQK